MGKKRKGQQHSVDAIDKYLAELQLARKPVAKDGSCLFRAVADQAWLTQANYTKLRWLCGDYIQQHWKDFKEFLVIPVNDYCWHVKHTQMWGGEVELVALSKLLKRKIVLYQEKTVDHDWHQQPSHQHPPPLQTQVTVRRFGEEFGDKEEPIMLAFTGNNHYDMVWSIKSRDSHALAQSIVYGLLVEKVFQEPVGKPRDQLSKVKETESTKTRNTDRHCATKYSDQLLKALDPQFYCNVALEMDKRDREARELRDRHVAASMQFQSGDKCHITLGKGRKALGEIVAVNVAPPSHHNEDPSTKWAQVIPYQEGGESLVVPYRNITLAGTSSRSSSSNRGQNRTSNQMATTGHSHSGSRQHVKKQPPLLPLSATQQQPHPAQSGGHNRTNYHHQPGRSHHHSNSSNQQQLQQQQQQPQAQVLRGKPHQPKSASCATTSTTDSLKAVPYTHMTSSTAATSSSVAEPKNRDQQSSRSRRTANPSQPPPAESILPLPTPPDFQIILESQGHSTARAGLDGQLRKGKKTTTGTTKRSTGPVTAGPKPLPQNSHGEVNESSHYYKPDVTSVHYPANTPATTASMQEKKPSLEHANPHAAASPAQRQPSHQQLVNTNGLRSDGSTSTSGSSDPESPPALQSKRSAPPHNSSVFFNSYSMHSHKQDGGGSGANVFTSHPPPTVTASSSSGHSHHTVSSAGGGSSHSHNPSHLPVGSVPPGHESSARPKAKSQSGSRVARAQPYHCLPPPISRGRDQQQRQPTSAASMLSESTMFMTSLMGRSFPQEILTQSQLSAITDAPECEWPILNPVGNKNPLHPSLPSSLHIDGPPVNPSSNGLPMSMDNMNSQSMPMVPFLYTTDPLQILMHEFNPPMHLLHNGGTPESKQQFLFEYAQKCLQVYSKYINDPDLEDVLGDLMCMRLDDFSLPVADGQLSVCTSYTSRAESEATDLTPMFEPQVSYTNYAEVAFFQQDALQGEGEAADEEEEYEEEEEEEERMEPPRQLSMEEKRFLSDLQKQRRRKVITPPSNSDTTNSQSPVVSPKPVDQKDHLPVASLPLPSSSQEKVPSVPATTTTTTLQTLEGNHSSELSDSKPATEEGLASNEEGSAEQSGGGGSGGGNLPPPGLYHPAMMPPPPMMYPRPGFPPYYPAPYPMYYPMPGMPFNFNPWMFHPAMMPQIQMMMMPGPFQQPAHPPPMEDPSTAGDKEAQGSTTEESEKPSEGAATRSATQDSNPQPMEDQAGKVMLSSGESQSSSQQSSGSSGTTISQPAIDHPPSSGLNASSQDTVKESVEQASKGLPTSQLGLLGSNPPSLHPLPSLPCRGTQMDRQHGSSKPSPSPMAADYEATSPNAVSPDNSVHSAESSGHSPESSGHSQQGKTTEVPPLPSRIEPASVPEPATIQQGSGIRDMHKGRESSHLQQPERLKRSYHGGQYHHRHQSYQRSEDEDGVEPRGSSHSHPYPYHNGGQYPRHYHGSNNNNRPGKSYNGRGDRRTVRQNYQHYQQDSRNMRQPTMRPSYFYNRYQQYGHPQNKHYNNRPDHYYYNNQRGYQHHSHREHQSSEDRGHHSRSGGDRNMVESSGTGDPGSAKVPLSSSNHSTVVDSSTVL